jgi:hypothetical protein
MAPWRALPHTRTPACFKTSTPFASTPTGLRLVAPGRAMIKKGDYLVIKPVARRG